MTLSHRAEPITEPNSLRNRLESYRSDGKIIGFVPTMGALHQGHLSLIHHCQKLSDIVVVSIFVNPTQFGPNEDYDQYPRQLDQDLNLLSDYDNLIVFAPTKKTIYPDGLLSATQIKVPKLSKRLCGVSRPHFFDGVCGVVLRLFNIVQPQVACFGQKDFQQLIIIQKMVVDLHLPIQVIGYPIIRDPDGLAMSSRNQYLSASQRQTALVIHQTLFKAQEQASMGHSTSKILKSVREKLRNAKIKIDYVELVDSSSVSPTTKITNQTRLVVAGWVGNIRLIDNIGFGKPELFE